MAESTRVVGMDGEARAAEFLSRSGYEILRRNWRTRGGEIDIIAVKGDVLVFVEVKTLPHGDADTLSHVLGSIKRQRIIETAKYFLYNNRQYNDKYIRFDVVVVDMPGKPPVCHLENAFSE